MLASLSTEPKSILIVKLSSIGDVIHSLPVATALRRRFPQAQICWLVSRKAQEIVSGHPHLNQVIVVGGNGKDGTIPVPDVYHSLVISRVLGKFKFEVALDLQGLLRSALFSFLSGARVRIGYRSIREAAFLLYNVRSIRPARDQHIVEGYLRFAAILGAPVEPVEFHIATNEQHEARVDELLAQAGVGRGDRMVAFAPCSTWRAKTWPVERMALVAEHVAARHGCVPVIVGSKADLPSAQAIIANCRAPAISLAGKTDLKELAVLLRRCAVMMGNDSGPTHLAAAVGRPVVAVYGPTDTRLLRPYGDQHITIVAQVPCRPCRRRSRAEHCAHLSCLTEVHPAQVCEAMDRLLTTAASPPLPNDHAPLPK